jgi:hypothetical protein
VECSYPHLHKIVLLPLAMQEAGVHLFKILLPFSFPKRTPYQITLTSSNFSVKYFHLHLELKKGQPSA